MDAVNNNNVRMDGRPDNEPAVAMLDWVTGEPNAKYYITQLLATTVGAATEKELYSFNMVQLMSCMVYIMSCPEIWYSWCH